MYVKSAHRSEIKQAKPYVSVHFASPKLPPAFLLSEAIFFHSKKCSRHPKQEYLNSLRTHHLGLVNCSPMDGHLARFHMHPT